ncbi:hypothetical protein WMY93_012996 [Mugilogobius chulae]|uniref:SWIM-type domain-containing protein n=1 Tax=Mugilogobius chulae TaxID=88201 RepID=A0AAW0NY89_9GOBI
MACSCSASNNEVCQNVVYVLCRAAVLRTTEKKLVLTDFIQKDLDPHTNGSEDSSGEALPDGGAAELQLPPHRPPRPGESQ